MQTATSNRPWLPPTLSDDLPRVRDIIAEPGWDTRPLAALEAFHELAALSLSDALEADGFHAYPSLSRPGDGPRTALVHETAVLHPGTALVGDVVIARDCELGPNAAIFGPTVIGPNAYIGPNAEVRRSLIFGGLVASHACYIGHSIVGRRANIAAQTVTAVRNLKRPTVHLLIDDRLHDTGLELFGALIGDDVQTACDVTIMPGRRIGAKQTIGPRTLVLHNVGA
jgi:NDP-sugar pyrophosphorylase family protein